MCDARCAVLPTYGMIPSGYVLACCMLHPHPMFSLHVAELAALQYKEQADWSQAQKDQAKKEHTEAVARWHRENAERKEREEVSVEM